MKVAMLISGQPRFCVETDELIKKLCGYDQIDWFFHLWKNNSVQHICGHNVVAESWIDVQREDALNKLNMLLPSNHNVAVLELADSDEIGKLDPIQTPFGVYKMFRGNYQVNELRKSYENKNGEYDLVIRARPDTALLDECNLLEIREFLLKNTNHIMISSNMIYPPDGEYRINDWFAIGLPKTMNIYCNAVNEIGNYPQPFVAEILLAYHCAKNNIQVTSGNFNLDTRIFGKTINNIYYSNFGRWA